MYYSVILMIRKLRKLTIKINRGVLWNSFFYVWNPNIFYSLWDFYDSCITH
jgi:hypothetical protein